jgi:hypothetical protein
MRCVLASFMIALCCGGAQADESRKSAAARSSTPPLEQLSAACGAGLNDVRAMISPAGLRLFIQVFFYDGVTPPQEDSRLIRPAQLRDERVICQLFDGKTGDGYRASCDPKSPGAIECQVQSGAENYRLLFRQEHQKYRLSELSGQIRN